MSTEPSSPLSPHILVVDDALTVRVELAQILEGIGCRVSQADSGSKALALLRKDDSVDFIFSDYNMPGMDGVKFITNARELENYKNIKSAMVTTEMAKEVKEKAKEQGVIVWFLKPFKPQSIALVMHKIFPDIKPI